MIEPRRSSSPVAIEDLLRLKRAERPGPEFWAQFEQNLRAKQLAAIVNKRPWWRSWHGLNRWSLPLGAAAALTVSAGVAVHLRSSRAAMHQTPEVASVKLSQPAAPASTRSAIMAPAIAEPVGKTVTEQPLVAQAQSETVAPAQPANEPKSVATVAQAEPPERPAMQPRVSARPVASGSMNVATLSEQIAGIDAPAPASPATATFASTSTTPSGGELLATVGNLFDKAGSEFGEIAHASKPAAVEPLAQLPTPHEARRARLLAYMTSVDTRNPQYADGTNVSRSRERIATHLSDDAIYDSIHRVGLRSGGVSIQF